MRKGRTNHGIMPFKDFLPFAVWKWTVYSGVYVLQSLFQSERRQARVLRVERLPTEPSGRPGPPLATAAAQARSARSASRPAAIAKNSTARPREIPDLLRPDTTSVSVSLPLATPHLWCNTYYCCASTLRPGFVWKAKIWKARSNKNQLIYCWLTWLSAALPTACTLQHAAQTTSPNVPPPTATPPVRYALVLWQVSGAKRPFLYRRCEFMYDISPIIETGERWHWRWMFTVIGQILLKNIWIEVLMVKGKNVTIIKRKKYSAAGCIIHDLAPVIAQQVRLVTMHSCACPKQINLKRFWQLGNVHPDSSDYQRHQPALVFFLCA